MLLEFPKYAIEVGFNQKIASNIYTIGLFIIQRQSNSHVFKCRKDIEIFLKNCAIYNGLSIKEYTKRWYILKAFLFAWKSNLQTNRAIYYHVMYFHVGMKEKISVYKCLLNENIL